MSAQHQRGESVHKGSVGHFAVIAEGMRGRAIRGEGVDF